MFGGLILMPLYYQTVHHYSALETGLLVGPSGIGSALAVWWAGYLVDRYGAGVVSFVGGLASIASTVPFIFLGANTPNTPLIFAMLARGLGVGLASMPSMTAAYRALTPEQISDATPQLNVIQRIGASIGTAVVTVILQQHLSGAGHDPIKQAHAFGTTFIWVTAAAAIAMLPTFLLMRIERRGTPLTTSPDTDIKAEALVGAV
jgi:MFS family permease